MQTKAFAVQFLLMKLAIAFIFIVLTSYCFACSEIPKEQYVPPDELISRTKTIVLAKVVRAEVAKDGFEVLYTFKTSKRLKGAPQEQFQILGHPAFAESEARRFDNHFGSIFWDKSGGRVYPDTDCEIHPTFSVGGTYLVFLEQPYHVKGFESILITHGNVGKGDKWLQYVESRARL